MVKAFKNLSSPLEPAKRFSRQTMTQGDLDRIYTKVIFGHIGFSISKSENSGFFRKYSSL